MKTTLGIKNCTRDNDYWVAAVKECGHISKVATMADLSEIAKEIYGTNIGADENKTNVTAVGSKAVELGLPDASSTTFWIWSGKEDDSWYTYTRTFAPNYSYTGTWQNHDRGEAGGLVICKSE